MLIAFKYFYLFIFCFIRYKNNISFRAKREMKKSVTTALRGAITVSMFKPDADPKKGHGALVEKPSPCPQSQGPDLAHMGSPLWAARMRHFSRSCKLVLPVLAGGSM
jgi:hypothetical protein